MAEITRIGEVVRISEETPEEFVRRNGPTLTHEVAYRFGIAVDEALKVMKRLEKDGKVSSRRATFTHGAGYEWRAINPVPEPQPDPDPETDVGITP